MEKDVSAENLKDFHEATWVSAFPLDIRCSVGQCRQCGSETPAATSFRPGGREGREAY